MRAAQLAAGGAHAEKEKGGKVGEDAAGVVAKNVVVVKDVVDAAN